MPKLVKVHNGQLVVATSVYTPTYSIRAEDYASSGTPPDGWQVMPDDVEESDFAQPWVRPTGADDAYPRDAVVLRNNGLWKSLVDGNVWEPGVSAWIELASGTPAWVQPTGAHDAYPLGFVVKHNGKTWRSLVDANVWEPPTGWRETFLTPPAGAAAYPDWVQPTGAHDAYQIGDRVRHAGKNWECTVANNVWEPGVYGWIEIA